MTPSELRDTLKRLGLSQTSAARLLRVEPRTMRRWIAEPSTMPEIYPMVLRLMEHAPSAMEFLRGDEKVTIGFRPLSIAPAAPEE